jgi:hypothetical protein
LVAYEAMVAYETMGDIDISGSRQSSAVSINKQFYKVEVALSISIRRIYKNNSLIFN